MISIGLTTWTDHPHLISGINKPSLTEYAGYFPTVEVDGLFYRLQSASVITSWQQQVSSQFQFILKAHAAMTQTSTVLDQAATLEDLFKRYQKMVTPLVRTNQLKTILFQFPPFFILNTTNLDYLVKIRGWLPDLPIAVEFRNQSWLAEDMQSQTVGLLKELDFTLVCVDEPQVPGHSSPYLPVATSHKLAMFRLHGQNFKGWKNGQMAQHQRTNYTYSTAELSRFAQDASQLAGECEEVCLVFNNNGGFAAGTNALTLKQLLNLEFSGLSPRQLDLF